MSAVKERIEEVHRHSALMAHAVLRDAVMWHWTDVDVAEAARCYIRASNSHAGSKEWREKVRHDGQIFDQSREWGGSR
ncbi:hypothetical protein O9X80_05525 [Agrobacterium salinitolerans]|uniref:hypothetical protein n=1 Tax=Agrobacterium salinitolerans TaxID=1183413 RepID=UPI0022B837D9|nr:hypothetical protein [Agrobacterium salinitolerans]MCZ7973952.1 hypothetical protein [Agrobacterium salinitolerans]